MTARANSAGADGKPPGRVLILRPDNVGDLILFSGALKAMREAWPEAHITLCAREFGRELFVHCPCIDELLPYALLRWTGRVPWPLWFSRVNSAGWMRGLYAAAIPWLHYDLAVLPLLSPFRKYHRVMQAVSAGRRAGITGRLDSQSPEEALRYADLYSIRVDGAAIRADTPELETNRLLLRALGIEAAPEDVWPQFWTTAKEVAAAAELLGGLGKDRALLGITPGAASPAGMKTLPAAWYANVVREMTAGPLDIVVLGASRDAAICAEVENALRASGPEHRVMNLAGRTSLLSLVEVIRKCDAMLCIDAAPLHIATALRRPVAGVLGGGHFGRFFPWGDPALARVVNKKMDCYGCGWNCKYETVRCVQEIEPEVAARTVTELLKAGFTLIELLVVLMVIGVLAALLMAGVQRANGTGKMVACATTMRQWALAFPLFAQDHNGYLPTANITQTTNLWQTNIAPYVTGRHDVYCYIPLRSQHHCPGDLVYNWAYATNSTLLTSGSFKRLSDIPHPEATILLGEANSVSLQDVNPQPAGVMEYQRHGNGLANFAFADMHILPISSTDAPALLKAHTILIDPSLTPASQ